jgi:hypothetical protein
MGARVGCITLGAWLVSPIQRLPESLVGYDGYLIKLAYDFDVEPDAAVPSWFEVTFAFVTEGAVVHDALPRSVSDGGQRTYLLNGQLEFVAQDLPVADCLVPDLRLPDLPATVQVFGVSSATLRWRHRGTAKGPVRPGSTTGWIVLLVPSGLRQVLVHAGGRFAAPVNGDDGPVPVDWPEVFTVALPEGHPKSVHRSVTGGRRVFISYTHDSEHHKQAVRRLCELLEGAGIDVLLDENESPVRKEWQRWMTTGIGRSDYVIVVASPQYRSVGLYESASKPRRGAEAEYRLLTTLLAEDYDAWLTKILPVVLPGRAVSEIPIGLQPYDADHYVVPTLTPSGIAGLLLAMSDGGRGPGA